MTQHELDIAVAQATRESLSEIRRRGFSIADPENVNYDPEPVRRSRYIDWDALDRQRRVTWTA